MSQPVLFAFTQEQAARLAKVSERRLSYWDQTGFFKPSLAEVDRRLKFSRNYTFADVVALRTLGALLNKYNIKTRYLRKVRECLKEPQDVWAKKSVYVLGGRVYLHAPETSLYREPISGQFALAEFPLERVIQEVEADIAKMKGRDPESIGKIDKSKSIARNSKVFKGTRVPINTVRSFLTEGYSYDDIIREFPSLTLEDIKAAEAHLGAA